jgi:hypothetical protein
MLPDADPLVLGLALGLRTSSLLFFAPEIASVLLTPALPLTPALGLELYVLPPLFEDWLGFVASFVGEDVFTSPLPVPTLAPAPALVSRPFEICAIAGAVPKTSAATAAVVITPYFFMLFPSLDAASPLRWKDCSRGASCGRTAR